MTEHKYEKEILDFLVATKAKAVAIVVMDGEQGSLFEVRSMSDYHIRRMPGALIEMASRIEKQINESEFEKVKKKVNSQKESIPRAKKKARK